MSLYLLLKHLHMSCVVLSGSGFLLRGYWRLTESPWLLHRLTRTLPHLVDTLLLGSALAMAIMSQQYPFAQGWLTAKVGALLAYIVFGTIALKRGKTRKIRTAALLLALTSFAYIVSVALTRDAGLGLL